MRSCPTRFSPIGRLILCAFLLSLTHLAHAQAQIPLPQGMVGAAYSVDIQAEGGLPPLTWRLSGGELPPGLRLLATGKIEGTPTAARVEPYTLELTVSDSSKPPQSAVQQFSVVIVAAPLRILGVKKDPAALKIVGVASPEPPAANPVPSKEARPDPPQQSVPNCGPGSGQAGRCGGQLLRTIVGFEQAGVSAAQSRQDFFFDLLYDRPLYGHQDDDLGPTLRSWGNLRISSVPQQINTSVAQFAADFAQQVGQLKVNEVAQSFEFLGGIEYRLYASPSKTDAYAGPEQGVNHRVSINLVLGGGVITPLSPHDSVQVFNVPSNQPDFFTRFPQAMGKQFVAFALPDRNRFFRQAYGGFRLKTHFLNDPSRIRFPETLDLTYGFNESVTGGRIRGGVFRLEGFVPIPYSKVSWIYFFGTGLFKPGGHVTTTSPFLLDQAPSGTLPTNSAAVVITTPQADRDYYRIGVGIDLIDLIKNWKPK